MPSQQYGAPRRYPAGDHRREELQTARPDGALAATPAQPSAMPHRAWLPGVSGRPAATPNIRSGPAKFGRKYALTPLSLQLANDPESRGPVPRVGYESLTHRKP